MLNTLFGIYLSDKFGAISGRIQWIESVDASDTSELTLTNAFDGAKLKADLVNYDYIATKYTTWTSNGIVQIELKPDAESINQLKTYSLTQKTESPLIPPKLIQTDISLKLTNQTANPDDVIIILDILKIPQGKIPQLIDMIEIMSIAPDNIDIQTLAIERYLIQANMILVHTNKLLEALIIASGGKVPPPIELPLLLDPINIPTTKKDQACKRI